MKTTSPDQVTAPVITRHVIFIDTGLPDYQTLIDDLSETTDVVQVASHQDGIQIMAEWAETHSGYTAIHVLGHGSSGAQQLGSATLSSDTLTSYRNELSQIGKALTEDADILLYGCSVAANETGVEFIGKLAQMTDADIAASDDLTGSKSLGGDWVLEVSTGTSISAQTAESYAHTLAATWSNVTGAGNVAASLSSDSSLNMAGDFDSDGDYDFVAASSSTEYTYFRNDNGTLTAFAHTDGGHPFAGLVPYTGNPANNIIADIDGDGDTDIISGTSYFRQEVAPPRIISSLPADNETGADGSANISLTFNETISSAGTGTIRIYNSSDTLIETITANDTSRVIISGSTVTINPATTLADNTGHYIQIDKRAFFDSDGMTFMGIGDKTTLNFTTATSNATPTLVGTPTDITTTEDAASNVDLSSVTFDDADNDTLTVTLTASAGTFSTPADGAAVGSGVTETKVSDTVITLVGSAADINTYLDTVSNIQYTSTENASGDNAATITITASDGNGGSLANNPAVNLDITAVNDAPVLDNAGSPTLTAINEDPSSNAGTLVSTLLGAALTDVDTGASEGIAVTAVDNTNGTWQYSTDGTNWAAVGTVSDSSALLLAADDKLRFVPDADYNGSATVTYRGWDQTSGTAGNKVDASTNGNTTAFSTATESASVTIDAVDDAPTGSGATTPASFTEDIQGSLDLSGFTVADVDSASVTITLTASAGTLVASPSGGVTVGGSSSALTLTGSPSDINTWLDTTNNVKYTGATNANGTGAATITITGADGTTSNVAMGSVTLNISAVDDAPTITAVPDESVVLSVGQTINLAASSVADVDSASVTAVISVDSGTLTATSAASNHSGGAAVAQTNAQTVTLTGSPAQVDAYLNDTNELSFTSAASTADVTLTVSVDDGVNSAVSDTATISVLDVARPTASNYTDATNEDTPVTAFSSIELPTAEDADTGTAHTVEYITIDTATVSGGVLSLTASATGGTSTVGGITFDTAEGDLSGTVNIAIGDIDHLVFTPTAELSGNGAGSFDWTVTDSNGDTSDQATWTLNITPVEDAPTLTGVTASITALEDTATRLVTGTPVFSDVDTTADVVATLTATDGSAVLAATDADGVVVGNSGSNSITLTGTADEINTFLATPSNITYTGSEHNTTADTVVISVDDGEGGTDANTATITVNFTPVNDEPVVSATGTGGNSINGAATNLFNSTAINVDTPDTGDLIKSVTFTVSGLQDGADETIGLDGTSIALADGTNGATTVGNGIAYSVAVAAGTATISLTHTGIAEATIEGMLNAMTYENKATAFTEGDRVVTLTSVQDDGGTTNNGDDTWSTGGITSTVTVVDGTKPTASSYKDSGTEDTAINLSAIELPTARDSGNQALEYITIDTSTVTGGILSLDSAGTSGTSTVGGIHYTTAAGNLGGTVHINIADIGKLEFTPTDNLAGTSVAGFDWTVTDEGGQASPTATYTLDLTNTPDAPAGTDKTLSLIRGASHTFSASDFGFTDADTGDTLIRVQVNVKSIDNGTLELDGTTVTDGQWIDLADIGKLVYTSTATGGDSFTFTVEDSTNASDPTPNTLTINVKARPAPTPSPEPEPEPQPEPELPGNDSWDDLPDEDGDGVPESVEDFVPSIGGGASNGDGNGDGIADRNQQDVASVPFRDTPLPSQQPDAEPIFVSLVGGSRDGKSTGSGTKLTNVQQQDRPEDADTELDMPLGLIAFDADIEEAGATETFSLYVEGSVAVNGYWKQNAGGEWVNLASADYGGKIVLEGDKLRLDFELTDGGEFDADGIANGVIQDPGALGFGSDAFSEQIQALYIAYYQRPADSGGMAYWRGQLEQQNGDLDGIVDAFATSAESQDLYGDISNTSVSGFIGDLYQALFDRVPESGGLMFYRNAFVNGTYEDGRPATAGSLMLDILQGAQGEDAAAITNKLDAAQTFTWLLDPDADGEVLATFDAGDLDSVRQWLQGITANVEAPGTGATHNLIRDEVAEAGDPIILIGEGGVSELLF
ncbi:MAG: DUF4347 domain-containing protein [Oceanospirillales bacterium]|nr:DUF4347 domain-containing protein [Oceanospirillales bacterium]